MTIEIRSADGTVRAADKGEDRAVLVFDGSYAEGDVIAFGGLERGRFYAVKADGTMEESIVLVDQEEILFGIPFGEKKTCYEDIAFTGSRHLVSIRRVEEFELSGIRNLSRNPFDQHGAAGVYPHASANVETRGEAVFAARNAVDGLVCTHSHGEWPYTSWGINRDPNAELTLEFGRRVDICEIRLYTRADFPHDNWWVQGTLRFSDGTVHRFPMEKHVDAPHVLVFGTRENPGLAGITWLKLGELIPAQDPSPFPALTQIEVYGRESLR